VLLAQKASIRSLVFVFLAIRVHYVRPISTNVFLLLVEMAAPAPTLSTFSLALVPLAIRTPSVKPTSMSALLILVRMVRLVPMQ
jgi:hypothetical protein